MTSKPYHRDRPHNPWTSARLVYRAIETPDDDEFFQLIYQQDPWGFQNSTPALEVPQARSDAMRHQKAMMEHPIMSAMICLPGSGTSQPTTIGIIHVDKMSKYPQHRTGRLGINIHQDHQGQGYGSEAIRWSLDFSFRRIGLHRVEINAFGWNLGAKKLYERLGFRLEGSARESWWHDGRYWDDYTLGMLDRDWEEIRLEEEIEKEK